MRNLALYKSVQACLEAPDFNQESRICALTIDVDEDALYVASDVILPDGNVVISLWKVPQEYGSVQTEAPAASRIASLNTQVSSNPWAASEINTPEIVNEVVSLQLLADTRTLVLITREGDIGTLAVDEGAHELEIVGSVEAGIHAASWGPDDSLLTLITGDEKLIVMTSTFDVLSETALHATDFGEDAPIALGWGTKQTQFHGSLGKTAAQTSLDLSSVGTSPDDDGLPRLSWRGDGAYFVVSALSPNVEGTRRRRMLRVYSREGALQSTSEPVPGLEHALSWRPSGNLIIGTQRFGSGNAQADESGLARGKKGRHDIVFFERNGLRHGEFALREWQEGKSSRVEGGLKRRWGYRVKEVGWSADSNVLSVWIEGENGDFVQLWTTGNYHWYLKQEIAAPTTASHPGRFTSMSWHPEDALRIILTTRTEIMQRTYAWDTYSSRTKPPVDTGSVAVMDGAQILLTPFRSQNVPPPMSAFVYTPEAPEFLDYPGALHSPIPVHASFSSGRDLMAVLWENGLVEVTDLRTRVGGGRGKIMDPLKLWAGSVLPKRTGWHMRTCRQVALWPSSHTTDADGHVEVIHVAVLGEVTTETVHDLISAVVVRAGELVDSFTMLLPSSNGRLLSVDEGLAWQSINGDVYHVDNVTRTPSLMATFPEFCHYAALEPVGSRSNTATKHDGAPQDPSSVAIGLSTSGKLHVVDDLGGSRTLAANANSFTVASGFLTFTTTAHNAHFAPLEKLPSISQLRSLEVPSPLPEWENRRVERGSRIVTAVPSNMSLILQMPRGNLETINPRPFVMNIVRQHIDSGNYRMAFLACRKHRIDLNVFVEHNQKAFEERIASFVDQVDDVDYINLFLTSVGQGKLPIETIAALCDKIRVELERRDLKQYVSSILTAHVVKTPPDHEAGLALLLHLRESEPELVEDAVKYIIFLVDANTLFDTALGMYDFSLVLMVAQHAQKDPREYLPFLRELRALEPHYQRFRIDDHLKRYEKALLHLKDAGPERFDEAMLYVERHRLYERALTLWQGTDRVNDVLNVYGDWLFERREFQEAAFVFRQANHPSKAMVAYEKALLWQELFDLALQKQTSQEDLEATAYRISDDLSSKKRYQDAARVLLDYTQDVRLAVSTLVEGSYFSEARRVLTLRSHPEYLEDIVYPGVLECRAQIAEELGEMRDQLRKQLQRIRELRVRKVEEPDAFYGVEDMELHNVDVMTDVSMAPTTFTRYTVAPSAASKTSTKRSSRSKRKLERKVGSGRKGTVDEEEYLLKSVTKLVGRFNGVQSDTANVLPHLLQFTVEQRDEGIELKEEVTVFGKELKAAVDEIWTKASAVEAEGTDGAAQDSWALRMQEYEKQRQVDPLEKVAKPELGKQEWTLILPSTSS